MDAYAWLRLSCKTFHPSWLCSKPLNLLRFVFMEVLHLAGAGASSYLYSLLLSYSTSFLLFVFSTVPPLVSVIILYYDAHMCRVRAHELH
jgi:hypothetical protein